mmetsp:Transcript_128775/g.222263  ORF Transcript_128775/g.222263 Transcript_128775/m.222263 type:complete len:943 (+) Transcript_128775:43-2871(+)
MGNASCSHGDVPACTRSATRDAACALKPELLCRCGRCRCCRLADADKDVQPRGPLLASRSAYATAGAGIEELIVDTPAPELPIMSPEPRKSLSSSKRISNLSTASTTLSIETASIRCSGKSCRSFSSCRSGEDLLSGLSPCGKDLDWSPLHDESSDDNSDMDEEPTTVLRRRKGAVCSESPHAEAGFSPTLYSKGREVCERLYAALDACSLFQALNGEELDAVIQSISVHSASAGECIIQQGDIGDALYIVINGTIACFLEDGGGSSRSFVQEREAGSIFGELSIMWNTPRSLSVYARDNCVLGRLARTAYRKLVVLSQIRARERREACLRSAKLLEMLGDEQIARLADALCKKFYDAGETIIRQGEAGHEFFIVQSGECVATVQTLDDVQEHRRYRSGDLFGEVALRKNAPRAATITACERTEVLSLTRQAFERMLGPLTLLQQSSYLFDPRKLIADFYRPGSDYGPRGSLEHLGVAPFKHTSRWFAVFRPTSRDAIAKMLGGVAVGKGLNVKGKSAKKNRLSGFVPFLQISNNAHKEHIEQLPDDARVKVFFKTLMARAQAFSAINVVLHNRSLGSPVKRTCKPSFRSSIALLDNYAPEVYGLELPGPLFYEAFITTQDLSPRVEWETGRTSEPAFMDMNLHCLCIASEPQVVLYQHDESDFMNPRGLLIAYAEKSVKPVVSDFDALLIGSQGIQYNPLPCDQADLVDWCLDMADEILQTPSVATWTARWLSILKRESEKGFQPTIPKYGFGDVTSIRLICDVVAQTAPCGAVRHGAECFNYYFPQELDDEYLVIWEGFAGKPWNYKTEKELRKFLMARAEDGFSFPLNPIWPVRDPGWYDVLLALRANREAKENLNCWFPQEKDIQSKIDAIHSRHKHGFEVQRTTLSGKSVSLEDTGRKRAPSDASAYHASSPLLVPNLPVRPRTCILQDHQPLVLCN